MAVYISFSACGSILNGSASGSLSSPNFPALFPSRQTQGCSWTIRVPSGRIKLIFHNFTLEEQGNSNCVAAQGARLRIPNVASDDNQANFTLCGPTEKEPIKVQLVRAWWRILSNYSAMMHTTVQFQAHDVCNCTITAQIRHADDQSDSRILI